MLDSFEIAVCERFASLPKRLKKSQTAISAMLGINQSVVNAIIKKRRAISMAVLNAIVHHFPEVNLHWLLTGKGEMFIRSADTDRVNEPSAEYRIEEGPNRPVFGSAEEAIRHLGSEIQELRQRMADLEGKRRERD